MMGLKLKWTTLQAVALVLVLWIVISGCDQRKSWLSSGEDVQLKVEVVTEGITVPFGMAFLPDGQLLVTDRPKGTITSVNIQNGNQTLLHGVPEVAVEGDGGIMDIIPHPDFSNNHRVFFCYAVHTGSGSTLAIDNARLSHDSLTDIKRVFTARPNYPKYNLFGSRLMLKDGYLYITTGVNKNYMDSAQLLINPLGKILRVKEDGSIPDDNPYVKTEGALPEIWCIGNRNPQGLTENPFTHEIWSHEHGPKGGDEINIIKPGKNYGWPVITYGIDYDDKPIGAGITHKEGMEQPLYYYVPSIAPSGMEFYTGDAFPMWKGNLFIGAMRGKHLNRSVIKDNKVVHEERLLKELDFRFRDVKQGPDGFLYVGVDGGKILRIRPQ